MWIFLQFLSRLHNGPNNPTDPESNQGNNVREVNASRAWYEASLKVQRGEYRWCMHFQPIKRRTFGRDDENDLIVDDESVSRIHAVAKFDGNKLLLGDTLSEHGTFVNGRRVSRGEWVEITDVDVIHLGNARVRITRMTKHSVTPGPKTPGAAMAIGAHMRRCA